MSQLPASEQNFVWGKTPAQISNNAKWVWEYMADNADTQWSSETGSTDIAAGMGGSLTVEEVDEALVELNDKGLVSATIFQVNSPDVGEYVPTQQGGSSIDVHNVSAITSSVDFNIPDGPKATLDLNCSELKRAYYESTAGADGTTFETMAGEVQALADEAASRAIAPVGIANETLGLNNEARIATIRICIKWRWLRIYIVWKI